ncbi:MAG TPA: type IV secretory system conjugative DNA transfer family protein [Chthoniobacterales bacterium]
MRASARLRWERGKHFLGVIDASFGEEKLEDGRLDRFAVGGQAVGIATDMHVVTIAGSRAGKGRAAILPTLLTYPGSVVAIDPKGELASKSALRRAAMGQKCHVLDPFEVAGEGAEALRCSYNPMESIHADNPRIVEDAGLLADAIIQPVPGSTDPHWDESAKNFLEGIILHVGTHSNYKDRRDLVMVNRVLASIKPEYSELLQKEMEENLAPKDAVIDAAAAFFGKPDRERESVLSTLRRHTRFLGYESMQNVLGRASISLANLKTAPTTVYLCLPAMRLGTCSRWLRMVINMTLAALEEDLTRPKLPVLLVLDEFAVLGHMKTIEDAAGQIAGLGCKLWPILQDLGQLKALYRERWETFLGNAGIVQCFGNSDLTTLEWISRRLGETTVRTETKAVLGYVQKFEKNEKGISHAANVHPLLTPEEISRYFGRDDPFLRQLIIIAGYPPLILQRAYYDRHEIFSKTERAVDRRLEASPRGFVGQKGENIRKRH